MRKRQRAIVLSCLVMACLIAFGTVWLFKRHSLRFLHDAETALNTGDRGAAITAFRSHIARHPNDLDSRIRLAAAYREAGNYDAATLVYEQVIADAKDGDFAKDARHAIGQIRRERADKAFAKKEWQEAADWYDAAFWWSRLGGDGDTPSIREWGNEAAHNEAIAYYNMGNYSKARELLARLRKWEPDYQPEAVQKLLDEVTRLAPEE